MSVTLYSWDTAETITAGLQSSTLCDEARQTAIRIADDRGIRVVVEDPQAGKVYLVSPDGAIVPLTPRQWPGDTINEGGGR